MFAEKIKTVTWQAKLTHKKFTMGNDILIFGLLKKRWYLAAFKMPMYQICGSLLYF